MQKVFNKNGMKHKPNTVVYCSVQGIAKKSAAKKEKKIRRHLFFWGGSGRLKYGLLFHRQEDSFFDTECFLFLQIFFLLSSFSTLAGDWITSRIIIRAYYMTFSPVNIHCPQVVQKLAWTERRNRFSLVGLIVC